MTKKLKLYNSSIIWETCFLLEEAVNWLQSGTANRLRASSANYSLSTPRLTTGRVYSTYVLPHAAETWAMTGYTLSPAAQ